MLCRTKTSWPVEGREPIYRSIDPNRLGETTSDIQSLLHIFAEYLRFMESDKFLDYYDRTSSELSKCVLKAAEPHVTKRAFKAMNEMYNAPPEYLRDLCIETSIIADAV